ncbi:LytTR family transcriptional regulator [bacterium]|nr:LytTR family transcriptional regulator [bacterium]
MELRSLLMYALSIAGFTSVLCLGSYNLVLRSLPDSIEKWNLRLEILWNISHLLLISCFNFLLSRFFPALDSIDFQTVFIATFLTGSIPLSVDIWWRYKLNPASNSEANENEVIMVKASGNYLECFIKTEVAYKRILLRQALKDYALEHPGLLRVHRSYLINPDYIEEISGNSNGGEILLLHDVRTPYSRGFFHRIVAIKTATSD